MPSAWPQIHCYHSCGSLRCSNASLLPYQSVHSWFSFSVRWHCRWHRLGFSVKLLSPSICLVKFALLLEACYNWDCQVIKNNFRLGKQMVILRFSICSHYCYSSNSQLFVRSLGLRFKSKATAWRLVQIWWLVSYRDWDWESVAGESLLLSGVIKLYPVPSYCRPVWQDRQGMGQPSNWSWYNQRLCLYSRTWYLVRSFEDSFIYPSKMEWSSVGQLSCERILTALASAVNSLFPLKSCSCTWSAHAILSPIKLRWKTACASSPKLECRGQSTPAQVLHYNVVRLSQCHWLT